MTSFGGSPVGRRLLTVGMALLVVGGGGCGPEAEQPSEYGIDFLGRVEQAELANWVTWGEGKRGGPLTRDRVGPGEIVLTDGTRVVVPPETPAGRACEVLTHREVDDPGLCLVAGQFVDEGPEAAWFATPDVRPGSEDTTVVLDGLVAIRDRGGMVAPSGPDFWLRFELASEVRIHPRCFQAPEDPVPASEVELPEAAGWLAELNVVTDRIVGIHCVGTA